MSRSRLKLESLEQRQLLAGITGGGTEVLTDVNHSNGNVYDQVLLTGASVTVTADAGQVTRVSFLDLQGDIVQAEFSGKGTLTISLDQATTNVSPDKYIQSGVKYVQGLASFTIQGSDASTNFNVFSVGSYTAVNQGLFDATHKGGDHTADIARLTIVADTANPNGSAFGRITAGNAVFSAESGVVGITAANIQIQNTVRVGDIDAKGTATPALVFGVNSQFGSVEIAGGDLAQTNGKSINNSGSYNYQITAIANKDASGADLAAKTITTPFTDNSPYPVPQTLNLTTAIDNIVGSSNDDVINASQQTGSNVVSALDKIDGGAGNDLLNISDATSNAGINGLTVKNVETLTYISTANLGTAASTNATLDTSSWTGLKTSSLTLQDIGTAANTVKAAKDTDLSITSNSSGASGGWTITGGKTVTLNQTSTTSTGGASVTGVDGTTSVAVTQSTTGAKGNVSVTDWATGSDNKTKTGTIATVSINGAVNVGVNSNALSSLSLTKVTGALTVTDELAGHATSGSGTTLAVALNESTLTGFTDTNKTLKEIDFTTSGKKSSVTGWTTATEVTTIKVAGDQALDLGSLTGLSKLATLTSTSSAAVTATVDATKVAVTGGAGADVITLSGQVKKATDLGGGDDWVSATLVASDHKTLDGGTLEGGAGTDTLALSGQDAVAASTGTGLAAQISGFEKLEITGGNNGTVDLHNLDDINQVILSGDFGGAYTLDKLASGASLTIKATQTGNGTINVPVSAIQNETLAVTLTSNQTDINAQQLNTGNINTVNLTVTDTNDTKDADNTINFNGPKTINISGNVKSLTTNTGTASTVDASTMAGGTLTLTSTAADGGTIKGTTKATNNITATGAGKISITTGDSADTIAVAAGTTITAGAGANVITASGAGNTITTGKDADTITVTATSGTTTITAGDGDDTITVAGQAVSNISVGGGTDTVKLSSKAGSAGYFTTITGAGDGDKLDLSDVDTGAATFTSAAVSLGQGATFSDYVAGATTGDGSANAIVRWFNFGGDTYVVVDNTAGAYSATGDVVVRLTGTLNLDTTGNGGLNSGVAAGVLTI